VKYLSLIQFDCVIEQITVQSLTSEEAEAIDEMLHNNHILTGDWELILTDEEDFYAD